MFKSCKYRLFLCVVVLMSVGCAKDMESFDNPLKPVTPIKRRPIVPGRGAERPRFALTDMFEPMSCARCSDAESALLQDVVAKDSIEIVCLDNLEDADDENSVEN